MHNQVIGKSIVDRQKEKIHCHQRNDNRIIIFAKYRFQNVIFNFFTCWLSILLTYLYCVAQLGLSYVIIAKRLVHYFVNQ
jgi:hypothetical protein